MYSLVGKLSLGNQWTFDNGVFVTGEWLGYEQPLISKSYVHHSSALRSADIEQATSVADAAAIDYLRNHGAYTVQVGVGYSW